MKILIYGAGVLGSLYGARLKDAGHDVTILARGKRLEEIRTHGIILEEEGTGNRTVTPIPVVDALRPDDAYDLIMVIMRKNQVGAILPALAANRATPAVLFLVNNAAGPDPWVQALGRDRVLLGFPGAGGAIDGPVVRYLTTGKEGQATTLGELDGQTTARLSAIAGALQSAGFRTELCPQMDDWLRTHAALVTPIALAIYKAGGTMHKLAADPATIRLMLRAIRESIRALKRLGFTPTPARLRLLTALPDFLLVPMLRRAWATDRAELVMARHAMKARDEMACLTAELLDLVNRSGLPHPGLEQLAVFAAPGP